MPSLADTVDKEHDARRTTNNPCRQILNGKKCSQEDYLAMLSFLERAVVLPFCVIQSEGSTKYRETESTCLHVLHPTEGEQGPSEKLRMVAAAVCNFLLLQNDVRRRLKIEACASASMWEEHFNGNDGVPYFINLATTVLYKDLAPDLDELAELKL